jgi:hypothetical protein
LTDDEDEYLAIAESGSLSSSEDKSSSYMAGTPEDMVKRFKEQAAIQKMQQDLLMAQQQSITELKNMVAQLLIKPKKKKTRTPSIKAGASSVKLIKNKEK